MAGSRPHRSRRQADDPTERRKAADEPLRCPSCDSEEVREIASKLVFDRSGFDFEVYHLGGCTIPVERWVCATCGREW
jgi:transposase-like protein